MSRAEIPSVQVTHIGGPTILLEIDGLRFLTDPTFDPAGTQYASQPAPRVKTADPTVAVDKIGQVDAVLLSHDQHFDNLDNAGRTYLQQAKHVLTTPVGAERLGGASAVGLEPWETMEFTTKKGLTVRVTATPARHGPEDVKSLTGDVTGWILEWDGQQNGALYISGDTVFYEDIVEIGKKYSVGTAFLHFGAAHVETVSPDALTLTAHAGIQCANLFSQATIIPIHYEGWSHFTEGRAEIEQVFSSNQLMERVRFLPFGQQVLLEI